MSVHSALTGADLHEPKGAAAAASGGVYVANGAGSGAWTPRLPSMSGQSGKFLTNNGTIESWGAAPGIFARCCFAGGVGPTLLNSSNFATVSRTSTGIYAVTFTAAAATANYQVVISPEYSPGYMWCTHSAKTTSGFTITSIINGLSATDATSYSIVVFGG